PDAERRCGETGGGAACEPLACTDGGGLRPVGGGGGVGSGMSVWRGRTYEPRRAQRPGTGQGMGGRGRTGPSPRPPGGVPFRFTDVPPHRRNSPTWRNPPSDVQRPNAGKLGPLPPKSAQSRPRPPDSANLLPNMATMGPGTALHSVSEAAKDQRSIGASETERIRQRYLDIALFG